VKRRQFIVHDERLKAENPPERSYGARILIAVALFALVPGGVFCRGTSQSKDSPRNARERAEYSPGGEGQAFPVTESEMIEAEDIMPSAALERTEPDRAEQIMKALAKAYPDRIGPAEFRDGDWAVPIRGEWYYYAGGKLLPGELREKAGDYDGQPFYTYPADLPVWKAPEGEEAERFRNMAARRRENPSRRSQHFFDALWRARTREEAWDRVKSIRFLGRTVMIHYAILEELALVEERILSESKTNSRIRAWIDSLNTLEGWNWRTIADVRSRSFHAYGAALDILPRNYGRSNTYWLWTAQWTPEWWTIPYEKRLHPPDEVVKAFEAYGFIWGGKWLFYDTMHFEYRPEILILNEIPLADTR
jgi:hypothetical protein